jgi:hypothetical protein
VQLQGQESKSTGEKQGSLVGYVAVTGDGHTPVRAERPTPTLVDTQLK